MEENKKKNFILILIIVVLVVALIIVSFLLGKSRGGGEVFVPAPITNEPTEEVSQLENVEQSLDEEEAARISLIESSKAEVKGGNLITPDNKVINSEGSYVRTDVSPSELGAPTQTKPLVKEELSVSVIQIEASLGKFNPERFTVKAGQPITISLTAVDDYGHSFVFRSPMLQAVGLAVKSGETRAMTFLAPEQKGEYEFYCNVGGDKVGHVVRGEIGVMVVE